LEQYIMMEADPVTALAHGVSEQCWKVPYFDRAWSSVRHSHPAGHEGGVAVVAVTGTRVRLGTTILTGFR